MNANTSLIENLQDPAVFDHPITQFNIFETHISWVILTGEYAYKLKKPLYFEFLDYSTLEKRRFYCEQEVELNKRLAPDLYIEVAAITGSIAKPRINATGTAIDYVVKMRQFSQDHLFSSLAKKQLLTADLIDALAKIVAEFHLHTPHAAKDSVYGTPAHAHFPVQQNFDQIRPLLSVANDLQQLDQLEKWAKQQYQQHLDFLQQRKLQGFIRDCHGDLHLGNIVLYKNCPTLFDRIEFNEDLRWTDVMADVAFLVMDLHDRGQAAFANRFLNHYLLHTGDYSGLTLLPYYAAYRAIVRAKVTLFRVGQTENEQEHKQILQDYRRFMKLAESYIKTHKPDLLITQGFSGSGKSHITPSLAERLDAIILRSDVERKRLFELNALTSAAAKNAEGIYTSVITAQTYQRLVELAEQIITANYSVIVDATFLKQEQRQTFVKLAQQLQVPFAILACQASDAILIKRIQHRQQKSRDPSDASVEVLQWQKTNYEALQPTEKNSTIFVDTENFQEEIFMQQLREKLQPLCPCGSQKTYAACCEPFLSGNQLPSSPETLMRSRYTAFTRGNLDYIERTMKDKACKNYDPQSTQEWMQHAQWLGLEVIDAPPVDATATAGQVEFIARYRFQDREQQIHERSEFKLENGQWYYVDGKPGRALKTNKVGRNDVCPCGSEKKYKKCCGK